MPNFWVYLVQGKRGKLYCGITTNPERRVHEHNCVKSKASKCAWAIRPIKLVWSQVAYSKSEALKLEYYIKTLSKNKKLDLINKQKKLSLWFEYVEVGNKFVCNKMYVVNRD